MTTCVRCQTPTPASDLDPEGGLCVRCYDAAPVFDCLECLTKGITRHFSTLQGLGHHRSSAHGIKSNSPRSYYRQRHEAKVQAAKENEIADAVQQALASADHKCIWFHRYMGAMEALRMLGIRGAERPEGGEE